jgi:Core-2/I-Branching enzyme
MSSVAAVVLAHDDPAMVRRLIAALDGVDIFLHCDSKAPAGLVREITAGAGPRVRLVPRHRTAWASWSLVEAELAGLQTALEHSAAEHLIVLSGSCYPLVSVAELQDELSDWRGLSRLSLTPIPNRCWDTPRNPDGGMWRLRRRFVTFRDQPVFVGGVPLRTRRRAIPTELSLHASSQWKIYARAHAAKWLRILDERPDLRAFWRTTLVPDEACAASMLRSPELTGPIADELRDDLPWFIEWGDARPADHPRRLGERDFAALCAARRAPRRAPDRCSIGAADRDAYRKLFARKLSSREGRLLDRIDEELRK